MFLIMKKFLFIPILFLLFVSCSNGQQKKGASAQQAAENPKKSTENTGYVAWKEEAKSNIRLLPKYGYVQKSEGQKEADKDFIAEVLKQGVSLKEGAENHIDLGFNYLYKGDLRTAMYRFNQAWLLDSTNSNIFSGFSAVYFSFQDYDTALKMLDEGLQLNPDNTNLLTDKATIYSVRYRTSKKSEDLKKAYELLNKSYQLDPKKDVTLYKLSIFSFEQGDCKNAKRYYEECMAVGGRPIQAGYADALKEKCK